jgi:uncharacterized protein (TIGR02145 family)
MEAVMNFKIFPVIVFFVCRLLPGISLAQNKVVVIPLGSDCPEITTVKTETGRLWMDRNLGAYRVAQSIDDYQAYGWLYQWGRLADGHEQRNSELEETDTSTTADPGHDRFITKTVVGDWLAPPDNSLWQGVNGTNNPCPTGFRLPTMAEWQEEVAKWNPQNRDGAITSALKIPAAGARSYGSEAPIEEAGNIGYYWTSDISGSSAVLSIIGINGVGYVAFGRALGLAVRCIKQ